MSKFRDDQNRLLTNALFAETSALNKSYVLYTLEDAKRAFVEYRDPTGYLFSQEFLEGYHHWKALNESAVLSPILAEWQEELEVAIRCEELQRVRSLAQGGHFQASKMLVDRGWEKRKAGKPSKEEVARETRVQSKMAESYASDIKRINRD